MSKIQFAEDAWEEYLYWLSHDKKTLKKINALLMTVFSDIKRLLMLAFACKIRYTPRKTRR